MQTCQERLQLLLFSMLFRPSFDFRLKLLADFIFLFFSLLLFCLSLFHFGHCLSSFFLHLIDAFTHCPLHGCALSCCIRHVQFKSNFFLFGYWRRTRRDTKASKAARRRSSAAATATTVTCLWIDFHPSLINVIPNTILLLHPLFLFSFQSLGPSLVWVDSGRGRVGMLQYFWIEASRSRCRSRDITKIHQICRRLLRRSGCRIRACGRRSLLWSSCLLLCRRWTGLLRGLTGRRSGSTTRAGLRGRGGMSSMLEIVFVVKLYQIQQFDNEDRDGRTLILDAAGIVTNGTGHGLSHHFKGALGSFRGGIGGSRWMFGR
mmetsp:Transcript_5215/g.9791  ORF Transcript_5215/g.9791 Transcript_5215/m.9791 type:complete len:318 (+) Transcript_5215:2122-3075(+)